MILIHMEASRGTFHSSFKIVTLFMSLYLDDVLM